MLVQWYYGQDNGSCKVRLQGIGGSTPAINSMFEIPVDGDGKQRECGEDSPTPYIEILRATALDDLLARDETIKIFMLQIGECSGLLGATTKVTTLEDAVGIESINPKCWTREQGAAAEVAADKPPWMLPWLLPARWVTMGVVYQQGLAGFWVNHLTCNSRVILPHHHQSQVTDKG